ncbi:MAG: PorT family protein [Paludibacter sp.]|nr:PorT family protein [Paludibacter sp.]
MKKIRFGLLALVVMMSVGASAQVGLVAGYSNSVAVGSDENLNGFHIGPAAEIDIQGPISLQYALMYNYLRNSSEATVIGQTVESTTTAHTLDLPVRLTAKMALGEGLNLFVFGGPNFNYAISQKTKGSITGAVDTSIEGDNIYKDEYASGKKTYSPFDLQLGVGAGLGFKDISVRVSYDWGMLDRDNREDFEWKNNDLKLSLVFNL